MSRPYFNVKSSYLGTGGLSAYTFDFKITLLEQIRVVIVDDTDEIVEDVRGDAASTLIDSIDFDEDDLAGGTVNLIDPLPADYKIAILLDDPEPSQDFRFRNKTSFTLKTFEDALDRIVGSIQGFVLKTRASIRLHPVDDESTFNPELPPGIADNPDAVIAVNDDGTGVKFGPTTASIASDAAAAAAARDAAQAAQAASESAQAAAEAAATAAAASQAACSVSETNAAASAAAAAAAQAAAIVAQAAAVAAQGAAAASAVAAAASASASAASAASAGVDAAAAAASAAAASASAASALASAASAASDAADAQAAAVAAQAAQTAAEAARDQAAIYGQLMLWDSKILIDDTDSPYQIDDVLHENTLIVVDNSAGPVTILMPPLVDVVDQPLWKVGVLLQSGANNVTVTPNGAETINGGASMVLDLPVLGGLLRYNSAADWEGQYMLSAIASDTFVASGAAINIGNPTADGSFRFIEVAGTLYKQKRVGGVWLNKESTT